MCRVLKYKNSPLFFYSVVKKCIENNSLTVWPHIDTHAHSHSGDLISYLDSLWFNITHTHTNLPGQTWLDVPADHLLSSFTSRSHISSLSHKCLPPWFTIDLLSLHMTEKDAQRGTRRYWGWEDGREGKRRKALLMPPRCCVFVVTPSSALVFIEKSGKDGVQQREKKSFFFWVPCWKSNI